MGNLILMLIFLSTVKAFNFCDCDNSTETSLYEQYCCPYRNRGKTFIVPGDVKVYILCPPETPSSCSTALFSNSHCYDVLTKYPSATSGYYNIELTNGTTISVYCDMEGVNCDGEGGWMRVAYLNMSDPSEDCPPGFRLYEENGIRACGRQSSPGCQSVMFPSYSISYSQVCGRVIGYQKGSVDGISGRSTSSLNAAYVDGVSLTRGNPRQHIWTFIAALQENVFASNGQHECPCAPNSPVIRQSFVGNDYVCESGEPSNWDFTTFHTDPLWDGKQCGLIEEACCNVTGIPWFNKVLQQPTTDYIELRVCGDQVIIDEDNPVGFYEIYVK